MKDILTTRSGGQALVAACAAAVKVWGGGWIDQVQYHGVEEIGPIMERSTNRKLKNPFAHGYGMEVYREISFRFDHGDVVKVIMVGETGTTPNSRGGVDPRTYWWVEEAIAYSGLRGYGNYDAPSYKDLYEKGRFKAKELGIGFDHEKVAKAMSES